MCVCVCACIRVCLYVVYCLTLATQISKTQSLSTSGLGDYKVARAGKWLQKSCQAVGKWHSPASHAT